MRRTRTKILVYSLAAILFILYGIIRPPQPIAGPTAWYQASATGVAAMKDHRFEQAEIEFNKAVRLVLTAGTHRELGTSYSNLAGLRIEQGRLAEARALYASAIPELEQDRDTPQHQLGIVYQEAAIVSARLGMISDAEPLIRKAIAVNEQVYKGRGPILSDDWKCLSRVLKARSNKGSGRRDGTIGSPRGTGRHSTARAGQ